LECLVILFVVQLERAYESGLGAKTAIYLKVVEDKRTRVAQHTLVYFIITLQNVRKEVNFTLNPKFTGRHKK